MEAPRTVRDAVNAPTATDYNTPPSGAPILMGVDVGAPAGMSAAIAATLRKHVAGTAANRRQRRRLLNLESATRRSLVGAKGLRP